MAFSFRAKKKPAPGDPGAGFVSRTFGVLDHTRLAAPLAMEVVPVVVVVVESDRPTLAAIRPARRELKLAQTARMEASSSVIH